MLSRSSLILRRGSVFGVRSMSRVTVVEDSKLEEAMKPGNKVLYFTATWCPPCRAIKPVYEKLSNEFEDIQFLKIDIDQNDQAAIAYKITSVPTFVFMADNKTVTQFSGAREDVLRANLKELSKKTSA
eukprot:gene3344-3568_t